jgi:hypothetical protein
VGPARGSTGVVVFTSLIATRRRGPAPTVLQSLDCYRRSSSTNARGAGTTYSPPVGSTNFRPAARPRSPHLPAQRPRRTPHHHQRQRHQRHHRLTRRLITHSPWGDFGYYANPHCGQMISLPPRATDQCHALLGTSDQQFCESCRYVPRSFRAHFTCGSEPSACPVPARLGCLSSLSVHPADS